jgi:fatty acid desaturase
LANASVTDSQSNTNRLGDLTRTNLAYSLLEIAGLWIGVAFLFLLVGRLHSYVFGILGLLGVTCLQQAFLTLLHDSWHGLLSSNRTLNDFVGKYLISFPCIKLWSRLKQEHLEHHAHLGLRNSDPTFLLYAFEPEEPRVKPIRFLASRLGGRVLDTIWTAISRGQPLTDEQERKRVDWTSKRNLWKELASIAVMQILVALGILAFAPWWAYFLFWVAPFFTTTAACNLIRTFCEHASPLSDDVPPIQRLISFKSNWLELFFIAPLHFNYHAEHHLQMSVPHYRLPALRRRMQAATGSLGFPIRRSYFEVYCEHFRRESA